MINLITGSAGFIGAALALKLLNQGENVIGVDNLNSYYSPKLKKDRLNRIQSFTNYIHLNGDLSDANFINKIFKDYKPNFVINLAAQAGVRHSIKDPLSFINSNLVGFANILEACRKNNVDHLVYASSSSVYGANTKLPYSIDQSVDHPLNFYAATKKSNELMAHSFSHIYGLPTTGLRFFTVYGPWDRPDMALQTFARAIMHGKPINLYNNGENKRDFTYIDDIVDGITSIIKSPAKSDQNWLGDNPSRATSFAPWRIYNLGNNKPISVLEYLSELEKNLGKKAKKVFLPIQPGEVPVTWSDINETFNNFKFKPKISINDGVKNFSNWFKRYYNY